MKGLTLCGVAVLIWSIGTGIIAKGFGIPALAWYPVSALIGTIVVTIGMARLGIFSQLWPASKNARWILIGSGVAMTLNNGFFFTGLQKTSVAVALLTHYLAPLLVAILYAPLFLKERITARDLIITLIGLIGLGVVLWPELSEAQLGVGAIFGMISAIFFAWNMIAVRKLTPYRISGLAVVVYQNLVPAILMFPFFVKSFTANEFVSGDWLRIIIFGISSLSIGEAMFRVGLQRVEKASHASIMSYGEPIGAIILAAIFIGEPLTIYVIVGAVLIVGAGIALVLGQNKKTEPVSSSA